MKKLLFFFLLPLFLHANLDTLFSNDEDSTLYHHVNVITGNLNLHFQDAVVQGAVKLPIVRTYTSAGALERDDDDTDLQLRRMRSDWLIQGGWNLLPHINLFIQSYGDENEKNLKAHIPEKNGSVISYVFSHWENKDIVLKPDIKGAQNSGILSARTNPRNNVLKVNKWKATGVLYLPNGESRTYERHDSNYFKLKEEKSSQGHVTEYTYNDRTSLKTIALKNPHKTKTFSCINFHHIKDPGAYHPKFHFQAKTSDGKLIDYHSLVFKSRVYLDRVQNNARFTEASGYIPGRKGIGARIHSLNFGNKLQFLAHYIQPPDRKTSKKWSKRPEKVPFYIDKVNCLEAPVGPNGEIIPVARFSYANNFTDARDAENILTRYHHDQNKLSHIEFFDNADQISSYLQFTYSESQLQSKAFLGPHKNAYFSKTFEYDPAGNVIKETAWGNFTGNAADSFPIESDGTLRGAETYYRRYSYDPNTHLTLLEEEEEGPTYHYRYLPGTDLITAQFTSDQEKICMRHFFFYNEDHLLTGEIVDDGRSENHLDLQYVTQRHLKHYTLHPHNGLVCKVQETYLDIATGQENHLKTTEFIYNAQNLVCQESVYDEEGTYRYALHVDYDTYGNIIRKTTPLDQENTYLYDATGNLLESKEVGQLKKIFTYNASGNPTSSTEEDELGEQRTAYHFYDAKGRLLKEIDAKGNTTTQIFDCFGHCIQTQLPLTKNERDEPYTPIIHFTYDVLGNLASSTSPGNHTVSTRYNIWRKPVETTQADGTKTFNLYNKNGTLAKTLYPDHTYIEYTYDIFQRMLSNRTFSAENEFLSEELWEYNAFNLLSHQDSDGLLTTYQYDGAGRKISEHRDTRETYFFYDALGFLEKTTDFNVSHITLHDVGGRVVHTWEEDQSGKIENEMKFSYDSESKKMIATRTTPVRITSDFFSYDPEGRLSRHNDPIGSITQFLYTDTRNDLNQNVQQKTTIDAKQNRTLETFDALNKLVSIEKQNPKGQTVAFEKFTYDPDGNRAKRLITVYDKTTPLRTLVTEWKYDSRGRVIQEIEAEEKTTAYSYHPRGWMAQRILPNGTTLGYSYDGLGRLIEQISSDGTIHDTFIYENGSNPVTIHDHIHDKTIHRSYNEFGQLLTEMTGDGLFYEWHYDIYGHCTQLTLPDSSFIYYVYNGAHLETIRRYQHNLNVYSHTYSEFDVNGHVAQETLIYDIGTVHTQRDILEHPISQTSPWVQLTAAYSRTHLITKTTNSLFGTKEYDYDALNQLIKEDVRLFSFDSLGNPTDCIVNSLNQLISTPNTTLNYDLNGNPTQRTDTQESYRYDAFGRLLEIHQSDTVIRFSYDVFSRLVSRENLTTHEKILYLYDQEYEIGSITPDKTIRELKVLGLGIKGDIGAAVSIEIDGTAYAPLHDFNGHIIALISSKGELIETYNIQAFGKETITNAISPWRFSSKRHIDNLIYFGQRFYDASLERWLTPDPAGFVDGANLYVYVLNNPMNRLDLFGLTSFRPWGEPDSPNIDIPIKDIENLWYPTETLTCRGTIGKVEVDFVVSCGHWHKLNYSEEELQRGSINLFDHFHEVVPKEGSCVGVVTLGNGINTPLNEFDEMCSSAVKEIPEGSLLIGVHNPTVSLRVDLHRVKKERKGRKTTSVSTTMQFIEAVSDSLFYLNPNIKWLNICHSEGGLILNQAIDRLHTDTREQLRKQLYSVALGSARPISKEKALEAINIYSENDYITKRFAKPFYNDPNYDIRIVNCLSTMDESTAYFADHAFMGTTYQNHLKNEIGRVRILRGFYSEKQR